MLKKSTIFVIVLCCSQLIIPSDQSYNSYVSAMLAFGSKVWNSTSHLFSTESDFDKAYRIAQEKLTQEIPLAIDTYKKLNQNPKNPFALTIGISKSQCDQSSNTLDATFVRQELQQISQRQKDPYAWLYVRKGYMLMSLPVTYCQTCKQTLDTLIVGQSEDEELIKKIIKNLVSNTSAEKLSLTQCMYCQSPDIVEQPRNSLHFTDQHWQAMVDQLQHLKLFDHVGVQCGLPTNRISLEIADFLQDGSTMIDSSKLQSLVAHVRKMKNPLLCMHHYTNPLSNPHMFEKNTDIALFATYCSEFMKAYMESMSEQEQSEKEICICPMSQPVAFGMRVARQQNLPPFVCNIDRAQFLQNIADANIAAAQQIKKQNSKVKVLFSHQFKPMKPMHGKMHPKYALESLVCYIADKMYNGQFVQMFKDHQDCFDGIALSVYPAGRFDGTNYTQDNCSGQLDTQGFLEAIVMAHKAFPTKDIYIVETGCNTPNQEIKKKFIDIILYVCQLAREMGISVKMCSLWGHMNEPYYEWEHVGRSHFGYFDKLDIDNPCASINDGGRYIQKILS